MSVRSVILQSILLRRAHTLPFSVPTDQWLTTRVDRTWTVSQVKHHMLTKLWGGRRYQLPLPSTSRPPVPSIPREDVDGIGITSISSSNYSSVVFAASIMGDHHHPTHRSNYTLDNPSMPSLVQTALPDAPEGPAVGTPRLTRSLSSENLHASRGCSPNSNRSRARSQSTGGGRPPTLYSSESELGDLRKEEAMERQYERIETSVRRKVHKAAKNYRLVSFSNVSILSSCPCHPLTKLCRETSWTTTIRSTRTGSSRLNSWRSKRRHTASVSLARHTWNRTLRRTQWFAFVEGVRSMVLSLSGAFVSCSGKRRHDPRS